MHMCTKFHTIDGLGTVLECQHSNCIVFDNTVATRMVSCAMKIAFMGPVQMCCTCTHTITALSWSCMQLDIYDLLEIKRLATRTNAL